MNHASDSHAEIYNVTASTQWTHSAMSAENQAAIFLWKVWPPCLLLLGGFGNIATIFVMRRIKDNNSSQHVILMALAVSDFSLLYIGLLNRWIYYLFDIVVDDLHVVVCKVSWWVIYATSNTSSWLLTCVTVQRTMAVKWPHKMRMMCSLKRTWIVIAAVVGFCCTLHFHFVFGMVISNDNWCTFMSVEYEDFVTHVWSWVDLTVFCLLPSLCLLICDIILSSTLFKAVSKTSMTMQATTNINSLSNVNDGRRRTASRTTVMILSLSCAFLVLNMPVGIFHIWDKYTYANSAEDTGEVNRSALGAAVSMLLCYTNSAVNFFLYCLTGTKFRGEFLRWICCDSQVRSNPSISDSRSGFSSGRKEK